jgi:phosphatidylglycerophosphatase C
MNLALFDFDGTISSRDSFLLFLWHVDKTAVTRTVLFHVPQIIAYKMGVYPPAKMKELFLRSLFAGKHFCDLQNVSEYYCKAVLPGIIRKGFWKRLAWHRENGDEVAVVSASPAFMLAPWCRLQGIELIGTDVEIDVSGRLTGRIRGKNCMGREKVRRINRRYDVSKYDMLFTYGDSGADLDMLELADPENRFYKPFR